MSCFLRNTKVPKCIYANDAKIWCNEHKLPEKYNHYLQNVLYLAFSFNPFNMSALTHVDVSQFLKKELIATTFLI